MARRSGTGTINRLLDRLPPGFFSKKQYRDISALTPDELEGKHKKTMDVTTIREHMNFAKSLFSFALDNEYLEKKPVVPGLIPPKKKNPRKRRDTFSRCDLKAIFEKAKFFKFCNRNPHRFWLPVLALFTGCRLEEMAQLYVGDVYQDEGLWVLDINADDDKQVKNEASKRHVPLHPFLIDDLKFHKYAKMMKGRVRPMYFRD